VPGRRAARASAREPNRTSLSPRRVAALIFLGSLLVYNANLRLIGTGDSIPARLIPFALLGHGTVYLDDFGPPPPNSYWFAWSRTGHLVSFYPVVLPIAVTPLFLPAAIYVERARPTEWGFRVVCEMSEKIAASVIAGLSVVVLWLALFRIASRRTALVLALAYAFATQTWSTSSQSLWQHGMGELLLACVLLLLVKDGVSPHAAPFLGALSALLVFNRPPDAPFAAAAGALVLANGRGSARLRFALGAAFAAAPFLTYNLAMFGRPLGGYQSLVGTATFEHSFPDGLAALLVSPGKGLLIYAPFLLFLVVTHPLRSSTIPRGFSFAFGTAVVLQLLLYATTDWRGGACYGPRFLTDASPFLILSLAPAMERLRRTLAKLAFAVALLFGVWVQAVGAFCFPAGGSYLLSKQELWRPSFAQFLVEARAGLAAPEFVYRAREWAERRLAPK
jgi:hypothetical protein